MVKQTQNPLSSHFRSPKLYTQIPSKGRFYTADVVEMPSNNELPVFPMTAKDELIMRNPDALLNGEAVTQVIKSCVPNVKNARKLMSNDIDALLLAVQVASYGDDIEFSAACPECGESTSGHVSGDATLQAMSTLDDSYTFEKDGLTFEVKPFTYETTIRAGITNFQSTRSLQSMAELPDDLDKLKLFNESFIKLAKLNFDIIVESVNSVSFQDDEGEQVVVTDQAQIREFLENCESSIGKMIEQKVNDISKIGIPKESTFECEKCNKEFTAPVALDPVNFSTAS